MKHPPIPENCEYFDFINGRYYWAPSYATAKAEDPDFCLDTAHPEVRIAIAAIARCAWWDYMLDRANTYTERAAALKHVDAWAAWGRGE